MDEQAAPGTPTGKVVDDLVDVVLGSPRRLTREDVARLSGVPLEEARPLWRAMGFADVGDAPSFTDEDVDALVLLSTLVRRGVFDQATAVDVVRALGRTTGRLASWQVDTFGRELSRRGVIDPADPLSTESAARLFRETEVLLPALERLVVHGWRRHLAAALERGLAAAEAGAEGETVAQTVGFADIVGFTRLTRNLDEHELATLVVRFESRSADIVAAHGGRTLKTLGDEIMFVAADPESGADIALRLVHEQDAMIPGMRAGVATGEVVTRRGDVYGTTVNLASRLTEEALPGMVLCDATTAGALAGHDGFLLEPQAERAVRGVGRVAPVALSRLADPYL
ncbi:MAG: adenylate/guanylate cyclase domain-containing protein [Candidatus Nanopelagicales bacterium]